jgi:hypothetical protein
VGSSYLNDILELLLFGGQGIFKGAKFWQQSLVSFHYGSDVDDRGESIIGRLGSVDVVIWVDEF